MIHKNRIELIGKITSLSYERIDCNGKRFRFFDIVQNDKLEDDKYTSNFFKVKLVEDLINKYKDIIKVSNNIYVDGYLNSYIKDSKMIYYIYPKEIKELDCNYKLLGNDIPMISYDTDGVMLWHGKRCEAIPPTEEERKEMELLLSEL